MEAISIKVQKVSSGSGVGEEEVVGRAEDGLINAPVAGHAFEEGGFPGAEVTFDGKGVVFGKDVGEGFGDF